DALVLEVLTTPEGRADPYPRYRQLRERTPVLRSGLGMVVLTRYADCVAALRDPRLGRGLIGSAARTGTRGAVAGLSADPAMRQEYFDRAANSMLFADPPEHSRLRRLVSRAFTPRRVDALRPAVGRTVDSLLDSLAEQGEADVIEALAFPLPVSVIGELVGVPPSDRAAFQPLVRAAAAGVEPIVDDTTIRAALDAQAELQSYFACLLAERRRRPTDDLLSGLAEDRAHDDALTDDEIIATTILLFAAGFETTTNLIGNGLLALLHHPDQLELLRRRGELAPTAVDELLRWDSPVQVNFRTALEPAEVAGEPFQPGDSVLVLQGAANRDPARFAEPERLDLGRADNQPLSFGWGAHHCIGAALARMEGEVVFRSLADHFTRIELTTDAVEWRPSITLHGVVALPVRVTAA
ncbi:MAG TPA: cytochrome P450, partial [Candidatus Dormibacteraeota bacterium]|nr:cytochrome P450 [Candidatus Dormibacteraeota bacterium]